MLITHDFGVVAAACDRVQVMYGGRLVERGTLRQVIERPNHPYTEALLHLVPRLDSPLGERTQPIPGQPPIVIGSSVGCRFAPRCTYANERCQQEDPPTFPLDVGHSSACWFANERGTVREVGE